MEAINIPPAKKYVNLIPLPTLRISGKIVYSVRIQYPNRINEEAGIISWNDRFNQYCFAPHSKKIFPSAYLYEIHNFILEIMEENK